MDDSLLELHARLACLGPLSRFRLALELLAGERCVTELAAAVGLSQSCTTRHLQSMERVGLVRGQRSGKKVMFRLESEATGLLDLVAATMRAPAAPIEPVTPSAHAPIAAEPAPPSRAPRAQRPRASEAGRRATPESDTPSAPAVSVIPPRYRELEDFLL